MRRVKGSPFRVDDPVHDAREVSDYIDRLDPSLFSVKGMFIQPIANRLGKDFEEYRGLLEEPPRGKYVPFRNYPAKDHARLLGALAERLHPGLSHAEGMRRLARADFHTFAASTLGKVTLAMVSDVRKALHHMPTVYAKVAPGGQRVLASDLPDGAVRIEFHPNLGVYAYQLGQIEEIARHFGAAARIDVYLGGDEDELARFDVYL